MCRSATMGIDPFAARARIRRAAGRAAPALLAAAVLLGCGAPQSTEPLEPAVRVYADGIRWQRFDDSASRLPSERRDDFLDERDRLHEDLRVHHYEIIRVRYGPEGRRARVHVKYSWYLESRGVVHETHAIQRWHRPGDTWVMVGEEYLRGEPMPGIEEPDADATEADADATEADPGTTAPEDTEPFPDTPPDVAPETAPDSLPETAPEAAEDPAGADLTGAP